jgi:hypothetical protein
VVRIHSPRPTLQTDTKHRHQGPKRGPFLDPSLTRIWYFVGRCSRVLIDLPSDELEDPRRTDQEV